MLRVLIATAAVAAAAVLAVAPQAMAATQTVRVTETNFRIAFSEAPRAGTVRFVIRNATTIDHDFWVRGGGRTYRTRLIAGGRDATLVVRLRKGVRYRVWCAVDSHDALGMNRTFTAR